MNVSVRGWLILSFVSHSARMAVDGSQVQGCPVRGSQSRAPSANLCEAVPMHSKITTVRPRALCNGSSTSVQIAWDCSTAEQSRETMTPDMQAAEIWGSASTVQDVHDGMSAGHQEPPNGVADPHVEIRSTLAPAPAAQFTTLMIRNTVRYFRNDDALLLWPQQQYQYDILYVPHNCALRKSIGYAFINFLSPEYAAAFYNRWQGQCIPEEFHGNGRPLDIQLAHRQGFDTIVLHWMVALKDKTMEPPVMFVNGKRHDLHDFIRCAQYVSAKRPSEVRISSETYTF